MLLRENRPVLPTLPPAQESREKVLSWLLRVDKNLVPLAVHLANLRRTDTALVLLLQETSLRVAQVLMEYRPTLYSKLLQLGEDLDITIYCGPDRLCGGSTW